MDIKVIKVALFLKLQLPFYTQKVGLEAAILLRKRNSSLSYVAFVLKITELVVTAEIPNSFRMVAECSVNRKQFVEKQMGDIRSNNASMSND